ncbi:MAG: hypothetical protein ACOVP6_07185 [Lacibacter sp.]
MAKDLQVNIMAMPHPVTHMRNAKKIRNRLSIPVQNLVVRVSDMIS